MIIERSEIGALKKIPKWVLVYGRRKTGKTFLVKHFLKYDEYFFVKRDKTILAESTGKDMLYETFRELCTRLIQDNKTVVVDEFNRLGEDFLDHIHFLEKRGKLILISSTFHLATRIISRKSPLLGLFAEFPVGLIDFEDTFRALHKVAGTKSRVELSLLMREPLAIDYFKDGLTAAELYPLVLATSRYTAPALVGEVFTEEERSLSAVYEGVLRAIADARQISTEISSFLFSRKLIQKDDPSSIQPYLNNLMKFGLIKRVKVVNKSTFIYLHRSPLLELYFYGDEKYNLSERRIDDTFTTSFLEQAMPRLAEAHLREFLAQKLGLTEGVVKEKDFDIDICLLKFTKPEVAIEVKWKKEITREDLWKAEQTLAKASAKRKYVLVPDKKRIPTQLRREGIVDVTDFIKGK